MLSLTSSVWQSLCQFIIPHNYFRIAVYYSRFLTKNIIWAQKIFIGHVYLLGRIYLFWAHLFCLLMFAQTNTPWLSITTPVCLHHTPNHTLQASLLSLNPHACAWLPKCTSAELRWHGWCAPGPVIVTSYTINCDVTATMPDSARLNRRVSQLTLLQQHHPNLTCPKNNLVVLTSHPPPR